MAPRYEIKEVQDRGHYWQVIYDLTLDDGTVTGHGHSLPKDTLEWRAAEYNFDPVTDFETILDIVLAEPYVVDEDRGEGEQLHDAPDIDTARVKHVNRCAKAKLKHRISTRAAAGVKKAGSAGHPLDLIRETCVMDKTVIAVKKEHVRQARAEHAERLREKPPAQRDEHRAERLAAQLNVDLNQVRNEMRKNRG